MLLGHRAHAILLESRLILRLEDLQRRPSRIVDRVFVCAAEDHFSERLDVSELVTSSHKQMHRCLKVIVLGIDICTEAEQPDD